jgi:hypothetical protein
LLVRGLSADIEMSMDDAVLGRRACVGQASDDAA